MTFRLVLALVVLAIDVWALAGMLARPLRTRERLAWIALIVGLPGVGAWLWWRRQRERDRLSTFACPDPPSGPTH